LASAPGPNWSSTDNPIVNDDYGIGLVWHGPMNPTGPLGEQGHRGCAAALLNSDAIARYATEALGRETSFDETLQLAAENHPAAQRIVHDAASGLGILIAAICNLTLPQRIIGGEGVQLPPWAGTSGSVQQTLLLRSMQRRRDPLAHTPPIDFATGDNI
jgi:predicted NBD/HSP70 family sugar kinase